MFRIRDALEPVAMALEARQLTAHIRRDDIDFEKRGARNNDSDQRWPV